MPPIDVLIGQFYAGSSSTEIPSSLVCVGLFQIDMNYDTFNAKTFDTEITWILLIYMSGTP